MVCHLCKYMPQMYIDFHMLILPFPLGFVCFYFGISVWSPRSRSSAIQTWEVFFMRPFTMSRPLLTTPRSLLMPTSLIAPPPKQIF